MAGTRNAYCSFCRKSYRDCGPLVEGPDDVYICGECIELCQSIIDEEKRRRSGDSGGLDAYLRLAGERVFAMAQEASLTFDQQLMDQIEHAKAKADATHLETIVNLSNAKMALGIVSQLLQRLH